MRMFLLTALSATALGTAAWAQTQPQVTPPAAPQGTVQAKAAIAECDRLISYLEQARPADAGVTVEQATAWRQGSNFDACRDTLLRVTEAKPDSFSTQSNQAGTPGTSAGPTGLPTVTSTGQPTSGPGTTPPPQVQAPPTGGATSQQAQAPTPGSSVSPQVVVQQSQPTVTVRQPQPEIIVRQAPPTITVHQPQPEIIVRMPQPDVNVALAQPQVHVTIPQPQVQVVPPQAQVQPQIQSEGQQPNVRFERTGEPRVVYQPAEGQPQIRFENAGPGTPPQSPSAQAAELQPAATPLSPQGAQAQLNSGPGSATGAPATSAGAPPAPRPAEPAQTGALPTPTQPIKVSELEDMAIYNGRGEKLGEVEKVLMGADNKSYLLVSHGGFLGLGAKQVAISSEQLALKGDRLVAEALTDNQVRAFPEFKESADFKEMEDDQTTSLRAAR